MRKKLPGFTLMELLIVIGVLGILAAGLLAAIDPFEQLKKARDTNFRNATTELLQGLQRFYTSHGSFPWDSESFQDICGRGGGEILDGFGDISSRAMTVQDERMRDCIMGSLLPDGEIKDTFMNGLGGTNIYLGASTTDKTDLAVCFTPESKSNMDDAATRYLVNTLGGGFYQIVEQTGVPPLTACTRQLGDCAQCFR